MARTYFEGPVKLRSGDGPGCSLAANSICMIKWDFADQIFESATGERGAAR